MRDRQSPLDITEAHEAGRVRVRLRGELDLASAPALGERLAWFCERGEAVLLDLDELDFIDMSGLRVVMAASEVARRDGWSLAITPGSPQFRRLIGLVDLERHLPLDGDPR